MPDHTRFHLVQLETALRRFDGVKAELDDDGEAFWLDLETDDRFVVCRWQDEGFQAEVADHEGQVQFQVEHAGIEDLLRIFQERGLLTVAG
jgi:hypothetical protein